MMQIAWHNLTYGAGEEASQPIPIPDWARTVQVKLDATHAGVLDIDYMNDTTRVFHEGIQNANSGTQALANGGNHFYIEPAAGAVLILRWTPGGNPGTLNCTIFAER